MFSKALNIYGDGCRFFSSPREGFRKCLQSRNKCCLPACPSKAYIALWVEYRNLWQAGYRGGMDDYKIHRKNKGGAILPEDLCNGAIPF